MSDDSKRLEELITENHRLMDEREEVFRQRDKAEHEVKVQKDAAVGLAAMLHNAKLDVDALRTRGENAAKELAESNEKWLHKFGQYNDDIRRRLGVCSEIESTQDAADRLRRERDVFAKKLSTQNTGASNASVNVNINGDRANVVLNLTPADVAEILKEAIKVWFQKPVDDPYQKEE